MLRFLSAWKMVMHSYLSSFLFLFCFSFFFFLTIENLKKKKFKPSPVDTLKDMDFHVDTKETFPEISICKPPAYVCAYTTTLWKQFGTSINTWLPDNAETILVDYRAVLFFHWNVFRAALLPWWSNRQLCHGCAWLNSFEVPHSCPRKMGFTVALLVVEGFGVREAAHSPLSVL